MSILNVTGKSGTSYPFTVYSINTIFNAVGGVYLFTKNASGSDYHSFIYLGITDDLSTRFNNHHKANAINQAGANHICVYGESNATKRAAIEKDILAAVKTVCNDQLN
jgi:predicted GIY-YIG superfamily endonuclease